MVAQQRYLYPVYISRAQSPGDFAVAIIGDPDAPPGDVRVHVVYPNWASATDEQGYLVLLHCSSRRAGCLLGADRCGLGLCRLSVPRRGCVLCSLPLWVLACQSATTHALPRRVQQDGRRQDDGAVHRRS
jgi:hypothetical protein